MQLRLYTLSYWSNPPFLISDIRALWRSVLSARAPECQKLKIVGYTSMAPNASNSSNLEHLALKGVNRWRPGSSELVADFDATDSTMYWVREASTATWRASAVNWHIDDVQWRGQVSRPVQTELVSHALCLRTITAGHVLILNICTAFIQYTCKSPSRGLSSHPTRGGVTPWKILLP